MRELARRLLAAGQPVSGSMAHEVVVVSELLRIPLTKFAGTAGFVSLLRRALSLASAEVPALHSVRVGADGRLEGLEQLVSATGTRDTAVAAAIALASHLLELLVTFLGVTLTRTFVRDAWPGKPPDEKDLTMGTLQ